MRRGRLDRGRKSQKRRRVLIAVTNYPLPSETYIETERRFIESVADTHVIARFDAGPEPTPEHGLFTIGSSRRRNQRVIRRWRPDVVHTHWGMTAPWAVHIAREADLPWTLRTHSFDVLVRPFEELQRVAGLANEPDCLGVLGFPFARSRLERAGLRPEKFSETLPVVDVNRFRSVTPRGDVVLSFGAIQERKAQAAASFARLSRLAPHVVFAHHPMGHGTRAQLRASLNEIVESVGGRVDIRDWVPHREMPAVYAESRWFVYPGPMDTGFGWPVGVAEAWAAGVGVCIQRVRPDIEDYVGDAAVLFADVAEIAELVSEPPDPAMLDRARTRAEATDISAHGPRLLDLWSAVDAAGTTRRA
jgi:glycosyltransferase involved in cell wall biosynthesis